MADQKMGNWENFLTGSDGENIEEELARKMVATSATMKELATDAAYYLQQSNVELEQLRAAKASMEARRRALEANQRVTRAALYIALEQLGEQGFDTMHGRILRLPIIAAVVVDDIEALSSVYKRIKYEANKSMIKADLEAETPVPGAHLEYTRSVVIK